MADKALSNVSIDKFKAWAKNNKSLARAVLLATAFARAERERVDAYVEPIFARFRFIDDEGKQITHSKNLYTCDGQEEEMNAFYEATYDAHAEHGFKGERGKCPALVAENLQMTAERAIIESGCELFCFNPDLVYGEDARAMLKCLIGACQL